MPTCVWMFPRESSTTFDEFDALTSAASRRAILRDLDDRLSATNIGSVAALFIDIDGLKSVNDAYGHAAGDELLSRTAARLADVVNPVESVGRLGGDEFLVLSPISTHRAAIELADRILARCTEVLVIDRIELWPRVSIGVALAETGTSPDALVADADMAMYEAKRLRSGVAVASESSRLQMRRSVAVSTDLGEAMRTEQIRFAYQPVVDLDTGEMLGAEALIRWDHPTFGQLPPPLIVERAEANGQIDQLTEWSLNTICAEWADLRRRWPLFHDKAVSFNMTVRQLKRPGYADMHHEIVARHGLRPVDVIVEVVESGVIAADDDAEEAVKALTSRGTLVALDDFGVGYNSLGYFARMPIQAIKVDRSLISAGTSDPVSRTVLLSVFELAERLGVNLVGEGIETEDEQKLCSEIGINIGQGFLLCRPKLLPDLEQVMQSNWLTWQARKGLSSGQDDR